MVSVFIHVMPFLCCYIIRHHNQDLSKLSLFRKRNMGFMIHDDSDVEAEGSFWIFFVYGYVYPMLFYMSSQVFVFFMTYIVTSIWVFFNFFVAVVLENFDRNFVASQMQLSIWHVAQFKRTWQMLTAAPLRPEDEEAARRLYWAAVSAAPGAQRGGGGATEQIAQLEEAARRNPFVGEPHLVRAQLLLRRGHIGRGRCSEAGWRQAGRCLQAGRPITARRR